MARNRQSPVCSPVCPWPAPTSVLHPRLPELFCGFRRQKGHGPTLYPVACAPQAWASATPFTLLEASLGLKFDPFNNEIRLCNPSLPPFLEEVILRNLQLGAASVTICVCAATATPSRSIRPGSAATSRSRWSSVPETAIRAGTRGAGEPAGRFGFESLGNFTALLEKPCVGIGK